MKSSSISSAHWARISAELKIKSSSGSHREPLFFCLLQAVAVFGHFQRTAIVGSHGADQIAGISDGGGFVAAVHCQLGQADICRGNGNMGQGNVAQRRAAQRIRPIEESLNRNIALPQTLRKMAAETPSVQ